MPVTAHGVFSRTIPLIRRPGMRAVVSGETSIEWPGGTISSGGGSQGCPAGTTDPQYCTAPDCVVPQLVGKRLNIAQQLLKAHRCRLGRVMAPNGAVARNITALSAHSVTKQGSPAGSQYPQGKAIDVTLS